MKNLENKSGLLIGSGIVAAVTASLCCIGPLILTLLGVSGAAVFAKFDFLRIPLIAVVIVLFGFAGYTLYKKKNSCEPGSLCADPRKYKRMITAYWIGVVVALLGIASPTWVGWLFG